MHESDPFQHRWKLLQAANALPLNQEAKRWLKVENVSQSPDSLYLFQLILWGLDTDGGHLLTGAPARRDVMEDMMYQLMGKPPALALKFITLTDDPEGDESNLSSGSLENREDPADAAWTAVDALDRALMEHLDDYPPKECPMPARRVSAEEDSSADDL